MKKTLIFLVLPLIFLLGSCSAKYQSHSFFAMDTYITVDAEGADAQLMEELENLVYSDEKKYSRTFADCEIYDFNESEKGAELSADTALLLEKSLELYQKTDGAFSPAMGALTDLWDIKSENPRVPEKSEIEAALADSNISDIIKSDGSYEKSAPGLKLDLGAIAKGQSAQNCIELLKSEDVENAIISFGGSIACIGSAEGSDDGWSIGIKNPFRTSEIVGSVRITDSYLAVSGAYERYFEKDGVRYHHIIDPRTGYPAESDIESTAVISADGAVADALSTALFVMGKDKALMLYESGVYDFEAVLIMKDGSITVTSGIADKFQFNKDAVYTNGNNLVYNK